MWGGATAAVLVLAAGVVVYLANQRGEEIARQRAAVVDLAATGKVAQAFRASKSTLAMKDGPRQELVGATSSLFATKLVSREKAVWLALGRTSSGVFFGQRFGGGSDGTVQPLSQAQEVSPDLVLGELRTQLAEHGVDAQDAQAFLEAAITGRSGAMLLGRFAHPHCKGLRSCSQLPGNQIAHGLLLERLHHCSRTNSVASQALRLVKHNEFEFHSEIVFVAFSSNAIC